MIPKIWQVFVVSCTGTWYNGCVFHFTNNSKSKMPCWCAIS